LSKLTDVAVIVDLARHLAYEWNW